MPKKKKVKSGIDFDIFDVDSPQLMSDVEIDEPPKKEDKKKSSDSILERRFRDRKIPKADEGVRNNDLSYDSLRQFYIDNHVSEFVKPEGKFIRFEFGNLLNGYRVNVDDNDENDLIRRLSYAEISKKSFVNNINLSVRYINYFIEYFDDDDELMNAYFQIMFLLHYKENKITAEDFIDHIIVWFATDSMLEKVVRMVEYNTDESLIKKSDRVYDESIQLTVEHLKAIMGVSIFHRFVIPVVSHFYSIKGKELAASSMSDKDLYYQIFAAFIPLFDAHYDISLYGKLYHTATTRISKTENQENTMWKRRNRFGTTTTSFANELMRDYLNEISQKTVFNRSAIVFLHVCFDKAIRNELIQPDKHEMSDMKMEPSDSVNETISRWDRWQMDKTQHSEKDRLRAYVSIQDILVRLGLEVGINFETMESNPALMTEYEYYCNNIKQPLNDTQMYIIQLYFASRLNSADDVKMLDIHDIFKLIMIMKRDFDRRNYVYLKFFISSTLKVESSRKCTKKVVEKLFTTHPSYQDWKDMYPDTYEFINMEKVYSELKTLISCPISVVDYDYVELRGTTMTPTDVCVADEFIRLYIDS